MSRDSIHFRPRVEAVSARYLFELAGVFGLLPLLTWPVHDEAAPRCPACGEVAHREPGLMVLAWGGIPIEECPNLPEKEWVLQGARIV